MPVKEIMVPIVDGLSIPTKYCETLASAADIEALCPNSVYRSYFFVSLAYRGNNQKVFFFRGPRHSSFQELEAEQITGKEPLHFLEGQVNLMDVQIGGLFFHPCQEKSLLKRRLFLMEILNQIAPSLMRENVYISISGLYSEQDVYWYNVLTKRLSRQSL